MNNLLNQCGKYVQQSVQNSVDARTQFLYTMGHKLREHTLIHISTAFSTPLHTFPPHTNPHRPAANETDVGHRLIHLSTDPTITTTTIYNY
jgi:hypothetical protein